MNGFDSAVHSDPEILNGAAVFRGTRAPVRILLDLAAGDSLDKFLDAYPSVSREQATIVLQSAGDLLTGGARTP